jgi:hypothetical protein
MLINLKNTFGYKEDVSVNPHFIESVWVKERDKKKGELMVDVNMASGVCYPLVIDNEKEVAALKELENMVG